MGRTWVAGLVVMAVLGGCDSSEPRGPRAEPSPSASPDLYVCGNGAFDPSVFEAGGLERDDPELRELVESLERSRPSELPSGVSANTLGGWHVVSEDGDRVYALARNPDSYVSRTYSERFVSAWFERTGDEWTPDSFEECQAVILSSPRTPALWEVAVEPSSSDTELVLMVQERVCSSGRKLTPENTRFDVEYTEDAISVVATGDPIPGGNCVDNTPTRFTVDLDEPVGDRALFDASVYPPERRYPCARRGSRISGPLVCSQR